MVKVILVLSVLFFGPLSKAASSDIWANTPDARKFMNHLCVYASPGAPQGSFHSECLKGVSALFAKELPANETAVALQVCEKISYGSKPIDKEYFRYQCYKGAVHLMKQPRLSNLASNCQNDKAQDASDFRNAADCFQNLIIGEEKRANETAP
jgi:hypothetical protein